MRRFFWVARTKKTGAIDSVDLSGVAQLDRITIAVQRGIELGNSSRKTSANDLRDARTIATNVHKSVDMPAAIESVLRYVELYPNDERLQALVARILERNADQRGLLAWQGIDQRFPNSRDAFIRLLRWTRRLHGLKAAATLRDGRFDTELSDPQDLLKYGRACLELNEQVEAEEAFDRLVNDERVTESVLVQLAGVYRNQRQPIRANSILEVATSRFGSTPAIHRLSMNIEAELSAIRQALPDLNLGSDTLQDAIIRRMFSVGIQQRMHRPRHDRRAFVGSTILINGSLGAGGAERQFTSTAIGLHNAATSGERIAGLDVLGPIQVVCRSLHSRTQGDFFVATLREHDLDVHEYSAFPEFGGSQRHSILRNSIELLDYLPTQMRDGLIRLTDFLKYAEPDIVHIWQDGTILAAGLAAILAGVPKIILGTRSLPPIDRAERYRPQYEIVYRSILAAPGVSLVANSRIAAKRYASWLDVPPASVHVIPNGVSPLPTAADSATKALAIQFDEHAPTGFTLGSVMRFDNNKRPLLWLDVAAEMVRRENNARFVLVGDGPLLFAAQQYAQTLGISERVLFVGASQCVGYWLTRMDVFLLLSEHEGLPNVLIEAQLAGVPVVTTPAGGAPEALLDGVTGTVLPSATEVMPAMTADAVLRWFRTGDDKRTAAQTTAAWANANFSPERMLELTAMLYVA